MPTDVYSFMKAGVVESFYPPSADCCCAIQCTNHYYYGNGIAAGAFSPLFTILQHAAALIYFYCKCVCVLCIYSLNWT